jgi:hypothetical protein
MSYLDDVCLPLIRLLEAASFHKREQLAGYCANLDFWVGEIRHALDVVSGYETRFEKLKQARDGYAAGRGQPLDESSAARTVSQAEISRLDKQLRATARRFLKVCCEKGYINYPKHREIEHLLGIKIEYSHRMT